MNLLRKFGLIAGSNRNSPAAACKERLQLVLAYEKGNSDGPDFLPELKDEILKVISKYVSVERDAVQVQLEKSDATSTLEISIGFDADTKKAA